MHLGRAEERVRLSAAVLDQLQDRKHFGNAALGIEVRFGLTAEPCIDRCLLWGAAWAFYFRAASHRRWKRR